MQQNQSKPSLRKNHTIIAMSDLYPMKVSRPPHVLGYKTFLKILNGLLNTINITSDQKNIISVDS